MFRTTRFMGRSMRVVTGFLATLACVYMLLATSSAVSAAERVALIIGNSSYQEAPELKNPRNDAEAVARMLSGFGFRVLKGIDVDQYNFRILVRAFTREIRDAKLALFYYAGHGLQVGRSNFLLPVDAELKEEADLDFESVKLSFILQQMERSKRTNIILMDACRDNPFTANLARNMGTRSSSIGRGLAPVETGVGTFVGFATQPGNVALDGETTNSPFTKAFIKHLAVPGLDIGVMMRRVREEVIAETDGKQVPWSNSSLVGDSVVLNPSRQIAVEPKGQAAPEKTTAAKPAAEKPAPKKAAPEKTAALTTGAPSNTSTNSGAGSSGLGSIGTGNNTVNAALELSFWNTIKDSNNPALFESYIAQYPNGTFVGLAKAMIATLNGTPPSEQTKKPAEKKKKVAALNPDQTEVSKQAAPKPVDRVALTRDLQTELRRVGCISARPDGIWGPKSRGALKRYGRHAGLSLASLEPSHEVLDHLRSRTNRVCPLVCGARYTLKGGRCVVKTCARGQVLTRKGKCIAKPKRTVRKKKPRTRKRREVVEEEIVEEVIRERPRTGNRSPIFDDEDANCPKCSSF